MSTYNLLSEISALFLKGEGMTKKMIGIGLFIIGVVSAGVLLCCIKAGADADKRMEELMEDWDDEEDYL